MATSNITSDGDYATQEDFDAAKTGLFAGLCVVGVLLLLAVVAGAYAINYLLRKLRRLQSYTRELHTDIRQLQTDTRKLKSSIPHLHSEVYCKLSEPREPTSTNYSEYGEEDYVNGNNYFNNMETAPGVDNTAYNEEPGVPVTEEVIVPVLELTIEREVVNVYGRTPAMGQVMMSAQDFYQKQTNQTDVCPAECIQVMDRRENTRLARSTVFTDDWMEGTPTSLLLHGSAANFENVLSHNKGLFVHKTVGPKGGQLLVSGARLEIPPGALSDSTLITLGVTWDEQYMPALPRKRARLSPVVLCQPSGLQFNVPVSLSFPHAADKILDNWEPRVLKRDGDLPGSAEWNDVTEADAEQPQVTDTRIQLSIRHFTLYTCTGESKAGKVAAKLMHIVAFTGRLTESAFFKPRLYCLNSYKDELTNVEKLQTKLDPFSKMAETTDLLVKDTGNDVIVELAKLSDEWRLAGDKKERLMFELVWHACHPHCSFVLKPTKTSLTEIVCEFHSYQWGNENNPAKLKVAEHMSAPTSPLSPGDSTGPFAQLALELAILLDPPRDTTADWRHLAERMGCDLARIRWLSSVTSSPTRVLLDRWLEEGRPLAELAGLLGEIERPDAAEEVNKYVARLNWAPTDKDEHSNTGIMRSEKCTAPVKAVPVENKDSPSMRSKSSTTEL